MPEIFNPVDDLIAEQALVDALVADFTEDDYKRMASYCTTWTFKTSSAISRSSTTARWSCWPGAARA